jgi:glucose 1-dehydrogenase
VTTVTSRRPDQPVTVITGGTRGIGAATARRLAAAGHRLVLGYRSRMADAEALAAELATTGPGCRTLPAEVTSEVEVMRLFEEAFSAYGAVTGLVNNAGLTAHIGPLVDTPVELIRTVIDVNLTGAVICARAAAAAMSTDRGGQGGVIVNVSSSAATTGAPGEYVHYAAAKAGVDALTVGLAKELAGVGIRVNAVSPGPTRTDIHADAGEPDRVERVAARIPLGRVAEPDEVAAAIAWLMGPETDYLSGANIRIAGGF